MRILTAAVLIGVATVASAGTDPIAACRTAHAGDSAAHITCLENALRTSGVAPATTSGSTDAAPAPQHPTGLGAEQAKARQRTPDAAPEQVTVRIVSAGYNAAGLGIYRMSDGQVWRETVASPRRRQLDAGREYAARIERGKVGGYRMYVDGVKWMYTVERLQ